MKLLEHVPLGPYTTLGVGGSARYVVHAESSDDLEEAIAYARERALPLYILGAGSNTLVPDGELPGLVLHIHTKGIRHREEGATVFVDVDAGISWEELVTYVAEHGWYGMENLAGIPGTVGGAAVQNIGAYGAEVARIFKSAECIDVETGEREHVDAQHADFSYRHSIFKDRSQLLITRVQFALATQGTFDLQYADVRAAAATHGIPHNVSEMVALIRAIRAPKFPVTQDAGTAGSFFKNPILPIASVQKLQHTYAGLPTYQISSTHAKVPLAWILDHILRVKGLRVGNVALFENQPLVIVAYAGASAHEVNTFANDISARVERATGIVIEREVETLAPKIIFKK